MQSRFNVRSPLSLFITGLLLYLVFGVLWWTGVYTTPKKAFEDMLENNLTTYSVTKNEFITSNNRTNLQRVTLELGAHNLVRALATVRTQDASATTETIATKGAAYFRYVDIKGAGKQDYSKLTNVWAKAADDPQSAQLAQVYDQSLLDINGAPVPPLGYVPADKRADMAAYMQNEDIFTPNYASVKQSTINGRQAYVYDVAVKLAPYLRLMQDFSHAYGLKDLDSVSPTDYQSAAPVHMSVAVDKLSHQMIRVSKSDNSFNETYTDYGIERHFAVPEKTISTQELRKRLNAVQ